MTTTQVIEQFVNGGKPCRASSVTNEGLSLKSYATYIAHRNQDGTVQVRNRKYSVTTSRQQNYLRRALEESGFSPVGEKVEYTDNWTVWAKK